MWFISHNTKAIHSLLWALCLVMALACADIVSSGDSYDSEDKNSYGVSSKSIYECVTATVAPDGSKWTYKAPLVNNILGSVELQVSQMKPGETVATNHGTYTLNKVTTDKYSDGNLTMEFLSKRRYSTLDRVSVDEKSIAVQHGPRFASHMNGYCKEDRVRYSVDGNSGTPRGESATLNDIAYLNGDWAIDPSLESREQRFGSTGRITLRLIHESLYLTWVQECRSLIDLGTETYMGERLNRRDLLQKYRSNSRTYRDPYDPIHYSYPLRTRATAAARAGNAVVMLMDMLNFIYTAYRQVNCYQNPNKTFRGESLFTISPNLKGPYRDFRFITPEHFKRECVKRQGSYPVYGFLIKLDPTDALNYQYTHHICINHFAASDGMRESIEILVYQASTDDYGDWTRWYKE